MHKKLKNRIDELEDMILELADKIERLENLVEEEVVGFQVGDEETVNVSELVEQAKKAYKKNPKKGVAGLETDQNDDIDIDLQDILGSI